MRSEDKTSGHHGACEHVWFSVCFLVLRQVDHDTLITVAFFLTESILRVFGRKFHLDSGPSTHESVYSHIHESVYMCASKPWTSFSEQNLLRELMWRSRSIKGWNFNYSYYRKWNATNVLWRTAFSLGLITWLMSSYKKGKFVNRVVIFLKKKEKWIVLAVTEKTLAFSFKKQQLTKKKEILCKF